MTYKYWLSICIPTYNRFDSLKKTIDSIISQEGFDNSIEIIISDNASSDNTSNILQYYIKYPNIKYYRNKDNLLDYNFILALSYANGEYIKLLSDNKPVCRNFLSNIKKAIAKKPSIIFHKLSANQSIKFLETNTINDFIKNASFYSTWLIAYTFRKDILDNINYKNIDYTSRLVQTIIALKVLEDNPKCLFIIGKSMIDLGANGKGGYNIFEVFINNYLSILKNNKSISKYAFFNEKNKLLIYFIFDWLWILLLSRNRRSYSFDLKGWGIILMKNYWYNPILYMFPFYEGLRWLQNRMRLIKLERTVVKSP